MQLPPRLRDAVDAALERADRTALERAAAELSYRYRAEVMDGTGHLSDDARVLAYVAVRLPATYAAIRAALAATAEMRSDLAPVSLLDAGAGPGTVLWAAHETWPTLAKAMMIEKSAAIRNLGEHFAAELEIDSIRWHGRDLLDGLGDFESSDLVTLGYVLGEIDRGLREMLIDRLWALTRDLLVIVEPGTPNGWIRMLEVRRQLIASRAHILAPCPHVLPCPLSPPDWCHFARRVARSRLHREIKHADVPWEDEKFIYLAASRKAGTPAEARVIARPHSASGRVNLKLCRSDGEAESRLVTRRDVDPYRQARRLDWGDALP